MKKRFTEAQIVGFLREADAGVAIKDLCRKHGFSEASYYLWRSKFGGMSVSDAKRLNELAIKDTPRQILVSMKSTLTPSRTTRSHRSRRLRRRFRPITGA